MSLIQEPRWLSEIKSESNERFISLQMPQEREESWRYTNLGLLGIKEPFNPEDSEIMMDGESKGIIFTDLLDAIQSHPELVRNHLGRLLASKDKFSAFHMANLMNGIIIFVPDGKEAKLSSKISGMAHTLIVTGKGSRLEYTEETVGHGFATDAVEIFAGEDSRIDLLSIQKCEADANRFSFKDARMDKNSRLNLIVSSAGAALQRNDINISFEGEGASAETICGFKSSSGHSDFMIRSNHIAQNTSNNITSRGTVDGKASSVFRGVIKIEKDAQKTSSFLEERALLLSDEAIANNIPSLEIDANDVKAKHGATVGQVDEDQIFYLMCRGLTREESEKIIVKGFFEPLITKIESKEMAEKFRRSLA